MNDNWRPQATIAISCVVLLPLWLALSFAMQATRLGAMVGIGFVVVASFLIVVVGIVFAVSGSNRGSKASRRASLICLFTLLSLLLLIAIAGLMLLSLRNQRWAG